jgi:hypothetical protein
LYCAIAHTVIGATIVGLIVLIEKTVILNQIQDACVIRSTRPPVPFIIGVASMLATVKDISPGTVA